MIRRPISRPFLIAFSAFVLLALSPAHGASPSDGAKGTGAGELRIAKKNIKAPETAGSVAIGVTRSKGSSGDVSVLLETMDGSATDGEDYVGIQEVLSWQDGEEGTRSFLVEILDDAIAEGDETVLLKLSGPTGGAGIQPGHATGTLRIRDNDSDPPEGEDCGECDGQVSELTLRYKGTEAATVMVTQRIKGKHQVIFEDVVEPGDTFTLFGKSSHGTLGPFIKISVDGTPHVGIHTSCSEPIGPGLVRGDFEVVEGFSRNGGPLCEVEDDGDEEPPGDGCDECDGKVTELTLRYLGDEAAMVRITQRIKGKHHLIFEEEVEPDGTFTLHGQDAKGTLGPFIRIYVDGAPRMGIHTSCSEPIGPGLVRGDFEVVEGFSRNGGRLCPVEDDGDALGFLFDGQVLR